MNAYVFRPLEIPIAGKAPKRHKNPTHRRKSIPILPYDRSPRCPGNRGQKCVCLLKRVNIISTETEVSNPRRKLDFLFHLSLSAQVNQAHFFSQSTFLRNTIRVEAAFYFKALGGLSEELLATAKSIWLTSRSVLPLTRRSWPSLMTLASSSLIGTSSKWVVWKKSRSLLGMVHITSAANGYYRGESCSGRCRWRSTCC